MNSCTDKWSGQFGDEYLQRNRVNWRKRIPFWERIMNITGARSVHEIGCNAGWNLSAIKRVCPDVRVTGSDINNRALMQARNAGLDCNLFKYANQEMVFTSGVLIHIPSDELQSMMEEIVSLSTDYVLAIEYYAEHEEEVTYRGNTGMLWKRPYGELYQSLGLELVIFGSLSEADGFDNCRYWLLRRK